MKRVAVYTVMLSAVLFGILARRGDATASATSVALGQSCISSSAANDSGHICMGVKYVVYEDSRGLPVATPQDALANLREINLIHSQCNITFQIEEFDQVDPRRFGLAFNTANVSDLDAIREKFSDPSHFLIVTTGAWNRTGSLGETTANAWTAMPGSGPYGAVIEAPVARYSYIFAHELGHYFSLEHVEDSTDIMNPVIYSSSTMLTPSQCETERTLATGFWREVTRS